MKELSKNYKQQKMDFLDSLQPDDFRNAASFNQADIIIDEINKALCLAVAKKEDPLEFITKAAKTLFRENSPAIVQLIKLSQFYLDAYEEDIFFNTTAAH